MAYVSDNNLTTVTATGWVLGLDGKGIINNREVREVFWRADTALPTATTSGALLGESLENNITGTKIYLKAPAGREVRLLITSDV